MDPTAKMRWGFLGINCMTLRVGDIVKAWHGKCKTDDIALQNRPYYSVISTISSGNIDYFAPSAICFVIAIHLLFHLIYSALTNQSVENNLFESSQIGNPGHKTVIISLRLLTTKEGACGQSLISTFHRLKSIASILDERAPRISVCRLSPIMSVLSRWAPVRWRA